jgi:hypothetical protein
VPKINNKQNTTNWKKKDVEVEEQWFLLLLEDILKWELRGRGRRGRIIRKRRKS